MPAGEERRAHVRVNALDFVAVGAMDRDLASELLRRTSRHLNVPCRLLDAPFAPEVPRVRGRDQFDADYLLFALRDRFDDGKSVVVGLTEMDLAIPIFTFVFGRAVKGGRAAVVSLSRLRPEFHGLPPDPAVTVRRGSTEVLHEVGHCAGLGHCSDHGCLMHFIGNVEALDVRGDRLCEACAPALPLHPDVRAPFSS